MNTTKSKVVIGTSRYGSTFPIYINFFNKKFSSLIKYSIKKNYFFFDTAYSYRFGNSQKVFEKLENVEKKIFISTKIGYKETFLSKLISKFLFKNFQRIKFNESNLLNFTNKALKNLNSDQIDIFYIHSPKINELKIINFQVLSKYLRINYSIQNIGISTDSLMSIYKFVDFKFIKFFQISYEDYLLNNVMYKDLKDRYGFKIYINRIFHSIKKKDAIVNFYKNDFKKILEDNLVDKVVLGITNIDQLNDLDHYINLYDYKRKTNSK